jgi:4-hydroxy-4-methyl-2-oxoglutarate aldolase
MSLSHRAELDALKKFGTPTLANAIETFNVTPPTAGFCGPEMRCRFPEMETMIGYAVTARVSADQPPSAVRPPVYEPDYWRYIVAQPAPRVAVVQDIDTQPVGALWGEVNSTIHQALGCVGMVTQGGARDLEEVRRIGFHYFSTHVLVSHGYGVFVDYGGPVRVAGLSVRTGDLLAGDRHGVLLIPAGIDLAELADVAARIETLEQEIFRFCRSPQFNIEGLTAISDTVANRWPRPASHEDRATRTF